MKYHVSLFGKMLHGSNDLFALCGDNDNPAFIMICTYEGQDEKPWNYKTNLYTKFERLKF